jgi:hypothetical protein
MRDWYFSLKALHLKGVVFHDGMDWSTTVSRLVIAYQQVLGIPFKASCATLV